MCSSQYVNGKTTFVYDEVLHSVKMCQTVLQIIEKSSEDVHWGVKSIEFCLKHY